MLAFSEDLLEDLAMEHSPERQRIHYYDALNMLEDRQDFQYKIEAAEAVIASVDNKDSEDDAAQKRIDDVLGILDEALGASETEEQAIFSGVVFPVDSNGDLALYEPSVLMDEELVFTGANYYEVNDEDRVLFEFRNNSVQPGLVYATPFEGMLRLELSFDPDAKTAIVEAMDKCATESRHLTSNPDVLAADRRDQRDLLRTQAMECYEKITQITPAKSVTIECSKYYEHEDCTDEEEFIVETIDQSELEFEARTSVEGDIVGVIYLEVKQKKLPFRKAEDFTYGGVPCIVVRNEYVGTTAYVPIDRVESIEAEE
ncbi:MAG TPA: hypothetical protein VGO98_01655 [Candidatus Saccharimonadales bacterium]|jgi:hypothetical protein|nr:hypothetical protein [Candidatus Saccharimonadales bacterium]